MEVVNSTDINSDAFVSSQITTASISMQWEIITHHQPHHDPEQTKKISTHQLIIATDIALLLILQNDHIELVILSMVT